MIAPPHRHPNEFLAFRYFSSRPKIFSGHAAQSSSGPSQSTEAAAVSAVGRAMANNPEATAKFMSAGLRHVANARAAPGTNPGSGSGAVTSGVSDNEATSVAGRVAAASMAFSASRNSQPPPSRMSPPPVAEKPSSGLVSVKKFGNVDTSSKLGFVGSLRSKPTTPAPVAVPAAFAPRQNNYGPPPVRRGGSSNASSPPEPPLPARRQPEPEPEPEEEEAAGEWADVLYDYNSGDAGDLIIAEGERVLVTERTSDDWWTGEVNGKKGLFPASYVKLL